MSSAEEGETIQGALIYNTNLFDAATIARLAGHYRTLLEGIVADPGQAVRELPMLTEAERHQILVEWNDTAVAYPDNRCVHELFEDQVARTPRALAVCYGDQSLTYADLNGRANRLAHYLQKLGVGPETPVGLCMERSLEMVIGLLGILKAGGTYVPLDPASPEERLVFMAGDAQLQLLLTQKPLRNYWSECDIEIVALDRTLPVIAGESAENPRGETAVENLAYVLYTSGSTGRPKGVAMPHRALANLIAWQSDRSGVALGGPNTPVCLDELRCFVPGDVCDLVLGRHADTHFRKFAARSSRAMETARRSTCSQTVPALRVIAAVGPVG